MSGKGRPFLASCEDADESDNPIEGTLRRAESSVASPTKEQPNTGRTRREKRRDSISPLTDSDSTAHPLGHPLRKSSTREREKSISNSNKKAMIPTSQQMRPVPKHARTAPAIQRGGNEAAYYGVSTPITTAATSRSRPQANPRPSSYYGNSRPPLANARFYAQQTVPTPPTSFPPPSWSTGPGPFQPPPPQSQSPVITHQAHQAHDYFSRPLEDRFSAGRPQSSIGFRPPRTSAYGDIEDDNIGDRNVSLARRPSASQRRFSKIEDDHTMPPTLLRRSATARPTSLAFRPPPTPAPRRGLYDEDDLRGDDILFQDMSPLPPREYGVAPSRNRPRRPSMGRTSTMYDVGDFRTEVAGRSSRRNSYYGGQTSSSGSGFEDQVRKATLYQEETGGPGMQLTAESLRKAARNGNTSSRSTRSSGSRDESDYKQSATTRTTRSSNNNDEDVTIRILKGGATLEVGGTKMKCRNGAEININSRNIPTYAPASGGSGYFEEERRLPRIERPPTRTRTSSQSGSYSRSVPRYDSPQGYAPYYQQSIPPYPTYPQVENNFF